VISASDRKYVKYRAHLSKPPGAVFKPGLGRRSIPISVIKPWAEQHGLGPLLNFIQGFLDLESDSVNSYLRLKYSCSPKAPSPKIAHITKDEFYSGGIFICAVATVHKHYTTSSFAGHVVGSYVRGKRSICSTSVMLASSE
jgi:hypothetical protein